MPFGRVIERHSEPQRVKGKAVGLVWGFRDATRRKRAEDSLRKSESRFRRLTESGMSGVTITDSKGQILEASDTFLGQVGYTR